MSAKTNTVSEYGAETAALWRELRDEIAASISSKDQAQYAANRLMAWPAGQDLLRRIVAHLNQQSGQPS